MGKFIVISMFLTVALGTGSDKANEKILDLEPVYITPVQSPETGSSSTEEKKPFQVTEAEPIAKVYIIVSGDNETTSNQAKSYLLRELRDLKDVVVVDEQGDADWVISVLVLTIEQGDSFLGYAVSKTLLSAHYVKRVMSGIYVDYTSEATEEFKKYFESSLVCRDYDLYIYQKDELKSIQNIITDFDIKQLEPKRQEARRVDEWINEFYEREAQQSQDEENNER